MQQEYQPVKSAINSRSKEVLILWIPHQYYTTIFGRGGEVCILQIVCLIVDRNDFYIYLLTWLIILYLQIDLGQPLEAQGPFDAIVHKVTDILAKADNGNKTAQKLIHNIQVSYS